ncbi:MAG: PEP-CTERM sorting domain-containing protein [Acidobacteria bacterium]|nr:PEP-CTERM sorting domain-containing protein [Acidobacteriota bacterium]
MIAVASAQSANAAITVYYEFTGTLFSGNLHMIYESTSGFFTEGMIPSAQLETCTATGGTLLLTSCDSVSFEGPGANTLIFNADTTNIGTFAASFEFANGAFGAFGEYDVVAGDGVGHLSVRENLDSVPEPGTLSLLGLGAAGILYSRSRFTRRGSHEISG